MDVGGVVHILLVLISTLKQSILAHCPECVCVWNKELFSYERKKNDLDTITLLGVHIRLCH